MQAGPSPEDTGIRSTLVSPAGSGGLRARLVRAASDATSPFVTVHQGRFARILLAELVGPDGGALKQFAWKLRGDSVAADVAPGRQAPSNAELDRVWQQERAELLRVHSPHVVAPVAVPPALTQSPPVFFCRRADSYFHPVCPQTGGVLSVCRDDAVLKAAGLPAYGQDTVRYLHSTLADGAAGATFYRVDGEAQQTPAARIESMAGLIRGWSRVLDDEQPALDLPCQDCEHRRECYAPSGDRVLAEQHLHAVSFYDVDSLALELAATDFDTAITRLGGGLQDSGPSHGWINSFDRKQRALEVLRLKLAAFADVCRGVAAVHAAGRPHLGVSPANIVAFDGVGSSAMPAHWRLRFALTDLGGATPVRMPKGTETETLWQPGREVSEDEISRLFLAPSLRSLEGGSVTMSVTSRALPDDGTGVRCVVDVHRAGVPSFALPGDLLLVEPVAGGPCVGARVDEVGARGLTATILPEAAGSESAAGDRAEQPSWVGETLDARLSFIRRSGPSADLYGLGMLLLRILLVHDEQSLPEVAAAIELCLQVMASKASVDDSVSLPDRWQEILDSDVGEGRFACWHVMDQRGDRQLVFDSELRGKGIIPKGIWHRLLGLAGRLLLASPLSRSEDGGAAAAPIASVLEDLATLERQLHVELFERAARDECIAAVCAQRLVGLRAELSAVTVAPDAEDSGVAPTTMPAVPPGTVPTASEDSPGFVLAIGRVGDSTIQQHHFSQDRVTIGRREGDNLLVLTDPMVSSKHAVIERVDGEYVLFDCGSTNGTEVDGIRLPVEVAHPLDDGGVIHIRPFMLSFRSGEPEPAVADAVPLVSEEEVYEQLRTAYAGFANRGGQELHAAMSATLDHLGASLGRRGLLASLEAVARRVAGTATPDGAVEDDAREPSAAAVEAVAAVSPEQVALGEAALRSVRQLARSLTDAVELDTDVQVQEFVGRIQRFVDVSTRWIEDMLEWRRLFSKQLDLRATQTGGVRPPLRTAAEVCEELLAPTGHQDGAAASEYFLSRFYEDVLAILEGLLEGNQRARDAVRQRLDPDGLVAEAGREAKLSILVQAAAGSALWKLYTSVFEEVTAGDRHETELRRLLALAAERRHHREL